MRPWGARGWTRALWAWWVVLAALGLGLIVASFFTTSMYRLKEREAAISPKVEQLSDAFTPLAQRQRDVPLALLNDFQAGKLSLERLDGQRLVGQPFVKLWVVDAGGHNVFRGDRQPPPPSWIVPMLAQARHEAPGLAPFRPLPGGRIPDAPASYLVWVARDGQGRFLVSQTDLDFIFGPWLRGQFEALKLGPGASYRLLGNEETWKRHRRGFRVYVTGHSRILKGPSVNSAWDFLLPTFFGEDEHPFQLVLVEVDGYADLQGVMHTYAGILGAFLLVMLSFALSLFLAGRTVRRELALAEARANFTAMVSHELKTPVAAIRMYGEILVNKLVDDPSKIDGYHQTIMGEATRLQRLIENLLDLGKIERGARTYELKPHDVSVLVEEAVGQATATADIQVRVDLEPSLEIEADADAARQAISNLVHNGVKYGGGEVSVTARRVGPWVEVAVADRGAGIPEGRRKAIFEPYVRLEDEARRESQGTGLGLALVKGYMEGQGGGVEVTPRPGGGSVFTLRFKAC